MISTLFLLPLARTKLGEQQIQGVDYAYTIQGWIKGTNSTILAPNNDMGTDGLAGSQHDRFGPDAFSYSLNYFEGDYAPIDKPGKWANVSDRFLADVSGSDLMNARSDLFNGNISAMATTLAGMRYNKMEANGMAYEYDQLNRLAGAKGFGVITGNSWQAGQPYAGRYENSFEYDANGNILRQIRRDEAGNDIEDMTYQYAKSAGSKTVQNRLYHVNDVVSASSYPDDIDDQGAFDGTLSTINTANNYGYDKIGNLIRDNAEEIDLIEWNLQGKITAIHRTMGSAAKNLRFEYNAMGHRVAKHVYDASNNLERSTWYIRDAQGHIIATYSDTGGMFSTSEFHMYGSSRLGISHNTGPIWDTVSSRSLGLKRYEGTNHLGNVLAVFSDKLIEKDVNSDGITDRWEAEVIQSQDYYPFGVLMAERSEGVGFRFSFNGMETDNQLKGNGNSLDFGARIYDSRLGRWLSVDPKWEAYPSYSPYCFGVDNPTNNIDVGGTTIEPFNEKSRKQFSAHLHRVFGVSKLTRTFMTAIHNQSKIDKKEFKKAIKGMSSEQKALARGYYKAINSEKKIGIVFGSPEEEIPSELLVQGASRQFDGRTFEDLYEAAGGLTPIADGSVETEYAATVIIPTGVDHSRFPVMVLRDGFSTQVVQGRIVAFEAYDADIDGITLHELIGHAYFGGVLGKPRQKHHILSIQIDNLYRVIKGKDLRSGYDHEVPQRDNIDNPGQMRPREDVTAIPEDLKKNE